MQISFILPIRNESTFICDVIDSILNQSIINNVIYEILIADGGSTDGTLELIQKYIDKYEFIKLIHNQHQIVSIGFNLALNEALGERIVRVDGHCIIPHNFLEKSIPLLEKKGADIVGGVIETIADGYIGKSISNAQSSLFGVGGVKFRKLGSQAGCYVKTLAFGIHRRKIFKFLGGYDEEMVHNQDDEFNFRVIQAGRKIWMDPTIKIKYFSRSTFWKLFIQYYNYGLYKIRGIQKRNQIMEFRHLVPSFVILLLLSTLFFGYLANNNIIILSIILPYCVINIIFSILISRDLFLTPLIFIAHWILHLGYGIGFILGLFRFMGKWKNRSLKDSHFKREQFKVNSPAPSIN